MALVHKITPDEAVRRLNAVRAWALKIPAGNGKIATVGFCWGGGQSFAYAGAQPALAAAVVFYGVSPEPPIIDAIKARSSATTAATTSAWTRRSRRRRRR